MGFEKIVLKPTKTIVDSRSMCDTSVTLGNFKFNLPVVPANMRTIIDEDTAIKLCNNNNFYIMHRFGIDTQSFVYKCYQHYALISISVGINNDSYSILLELLKNKMEPEYITIDVANGWSIKAIKMLQYLKENFPKSFIIVGNVGTPEACKELEDYGADAIKVGIGLGATCTTADKTGFGTRGRQFHTIRECRDATDLPIISDGGIRCHGDIAKAIVAGATMVMSGYLFAGHKGGPSTGQYYGSASEYNKDEKKHIEGKMLHVQEKPPISEIMCEIREDLQSAISYSGGTTLETLKKAKWFEL
jgi:GMP reductase